MHRNCRLSALFSITVLLAAACGGSETDAASIEFTSTLIEDGTLPIPRNPEGGTPVGIAVKDATGASTTIDLEELECVSSDETFISIRYLGELIIVTALADRFDHPPTPDAGTDASAEEDAGMANTEPYGVEPMAKITCTAGDLTATVNAYGVVDAAGLWRIEAAGTVNEVTFEQIGRELFVPGTTEPTGRIDDATVTIHRAETILTGTLSSRTEVSGMVGFVEWRGKKDP